MGGGDLNTKKSWHPNTIKNQERVWKAEQQNAAEKRKLAELQREIHEERNREELIGIAKKSGLIEGQDDKKLEWMYNGPKNLINREDYLLGKAIDKTYEKLEIQEKTQAAGISVPKNHVEHECIPFSIREYKKGVSSKDQVDLARKLIEDPLMAIKQKEIESRQKILENPVKLKELHRLLKQDAIGPKKSKKKDKKAKKRKNDSDLDANEGDEKNLDKMLAAKYKKIQSNIDDEGAEDLTLDKLLSMKYQKLTKELDKMSKKRKKKKKTKHSESDEDSDSDSHQKRDKNYGHKQNQGERDREREMHDFHHRRSSDNSRYQNRDNRSDNRSNREERKRYYEKEQSDKGDRKKDYNNSSSAQEKYRERHSRYDKHSHDDRRSPENKRKYYRSEGEKQSSRKSVRESSPPRGKRERDNSSSDDRRRSNTRKQISKRDTSSSSSSSSNNERPAPKRNTDNSDEERYEKKKHYGLVTASGKQLELHRKSEVKLYKKEEIKAHQATTKAVWSRPEKKNISEEETEKRRQEMLQNADWRDKERKKNVKRYKEEEDLQKQKDNAKDFDRNFVNKQFQKAANNETVESRIKSNRNNIQRSGRAMDSHFAKR